MRVLHAHWTALPTTGGVEAHCASVVRQLGALGVDAGLLSGTPDPDAGGYHPALAIGTTPTEAELADLVDRLAEADVAHLHNPQWHKPEVAAEVAGRLRGRDTRLVFDLHNIDADDAQWAFLAGLAPEYVVHSAFVAGEVAAHVPGVGTTVLPLALDRVDTDYRLPRPGAVTVLQPTRLTTWKGSDLTLRAVVTLLRRGVADLGFVHAGTRHLLWPSNIPRSLLDEVALWRARGSIEFTHYSPAQSWAAIAAADVVTHPTADRGAHGEPFSLAVAQAVICGKPVVASDSGNLPALLADYSAATLVPSGDQAALTEALASAVTDPAPATTVADRDLAGRLLTGFATAGARHLDFYKAITGGP
ncbi:glycosyltransferase family 4 protein [Saccharothrix lopnurensis]|uniref:Glycosyltransferase family 4 protein n=1 Tax=Saccharothrix lopnurensis TaxID=1670621 RepID=A0ABW1PC58_9PSEU